MRPTLTPVPEDSIDSSDGPRFADVTEISSHLVDEIPNNSGLAIIDYGPPPRSICVYSVKEIDKVCVQMATSETETKYYHILRGEGVLSILFNFSGLENSGGQFFLLSSLRRISPNYDHIPIKKVCTNHPGEYPFQAAELEDQDLFTSTIDQTSGTFFLYKNVTHFIAGSELKCDLNLKFPCWSKCVNSDNQSCVTATGASCKEQARDMALDIVVVEITDTCVIERSPSTISIPIWVKATVGNRDLGKKTRREPKGSGTQIKCALKKSSTPSVIIENLKRVWANMSLEEKQAARAVTNQM